MLTDEESMDGRISAAATKPLDINWPQSTRKRVIYVLLMPLVLPLWSTLPDVRRPVSCRW